eukprot:SAG31_NODE_27428_length_426_cov_0.788991_1_plen_121_part_01
MLLCLLEAGIALLYWGAPGRLDPLRPTTFVFVMLAIVDAVGTLLCWLAATQCQAGAEILNESFSGSFERDIETMTFNSSGPAGLQEPRGFFCYVDFTDGLAVEWMAPYSPTTTHFDAAILL